MVEIPNIDLLRNNSGIRHPLNLAGESPYDMKRSSSSRQPVLKDSEERYQTTNNNKRNRECNFNHNYNTDVKEQEPEYVRNPLH